MSNAFGGRRVTAGTEPTGRCIFCVLPIGGAGVSGWVGLAVIVAARDVAIDCGVCDECVVRLVAADTARTLTGA